MGLPGETISLPVCEQPTYYAQENLTCTALRVPIHTLAELSLRDSFIGPRENHNVEKRVGFELETSRYAVIAKTGPTCPDNIIITNSHFDIPKVDIIES